MSNGLATHFIELRNRVLYSLCFFVVSFLCIYPFNNFVFDDLVNYLDPFIQIELIAVEVASPFIVPLKLTAYLAALIAMPFFIFQILAFMSPGLYPKERSVIFSRTILGALLFYLGVIFCLLVVLPNVLNFFQTVGPSIITVSPDISYFMNFVLSMAFGFGLAFQIPILVNALIVLGILPKSKIKAYRGVVLVICFIFGMIFTPPDIISQFMMAIPMYVLFEIGLLFSYEKKAKSTG